MSGSRWKRRERNAARRLGAERNVGSGSCGRAGSLGVTSSDSTHDKLFIETKSRAVHAARTLWDATAKLAKGEGKIPVVALASNGKPGILYCIHERDLDDFAAEVVRARSRREATSIETPNPTEIQNDA